MNSTGNKYIDTFVTNAVQWAITRTREAQAATSIHLVDQIKREILPELRKAGPEERKAGLDALAEFREWYDAQKGLNLE